MGEGLAVGTVEGPQIYFVEADACAHGHDGAQQFAMLAGIELDTGQLVPAFLLALVAHVPDKIVVGCGAKPSLQYVADAVALILPPQQVPGALQL